ncbi:Guanine nucleotide-binding protein subunit alpha [Histomonas meleagridis]|uniref:Guanine nucleotide-binding protein subunit alpha n=1 Tax=Histomonas meleagridis TaxID=135588 RepID=UPI003559F7CE|nr:Guanine nucleotide-binding protein subunit alpha [Histomonas meleagridis]KAH0805708.1 Guanine nucleotide-binding protein subunit alpha [Histomonas meleagridis]
MGCFASKTDDASKPKSTKPSQPQNDTPEPAATPQASTPNDNSIKITPGEFDDHDIKILTLGAGECGKSTIWRQLKLIYCGGFSEEERMAMKSVININLIYDIKALIDAQKRNGQSVAAELSGCIDDISSLQLNEDELIPEIAQEIKQIWNDPIMKVTYKENNSIGIGDNAAYFFDKVEQIAQQDYVPTNEDLLKSRIRTTGISDINFFIDNNIKTQLVDVGGQKSERARWPRCFQGVNFLLFVVSLSDFDQCMFEDEATTRTDDSKELFGSIANSEVFKNKPIFLVLNKVDVFKAKLENHPEKFQQAYSDFRGDTSNPDECIEHVKQTFLSELKPDRAESAWVQVIPTCAMEEQSIRNLFQIVAQKVVEFHRQQ